MERLRVEQDRLREEKQKRKKQKEEQRKKEELLQEKKEQEIQKKLKKEQREELQRQREEEERRLQEIINKSKEQDKILEQNKNTLRQKSLSRSSLRGVGSSGPSDPMTHKIQLEKGKKKKKVVEQMEQLDRDLEKFKQKFDMESKFKEVELEEVEEIDGQLDAMINFMEARLLIRGDEGDDDDTKIEEIFDLDLDELLKK